MEQASVGKTVDGRGRKEITDDTKVLAQALYEIKIGEFKLTHYMRHKLMDAGYLTTERRSPPNGGRGRPVEVPILTKTGGRLASLWLAFQANESKKSKAA